MRGVSKFELGGHGDSLEAAFSFHIHAMCAIEVDAGDLGAYLFKFRGNKDPIISSPSERGVAEEVLGCYNRDDRPYISICRDQVIFERVNHNFYLCECKVYSVEFRYKIYLKL